MDCINNVSQQQLTVSSSRCHIAKRTISPTDSGVCTQLGAVHLPAKDSFCFEDNGVLKEYILHVII